MKNPTYAVRVWGNQDLAGGGWINSKHMKDMMGLSALCGVSDLMRYEILHRHGGVYIDADSVCLRPLEDWLLEPTEFASWANEFVKPGLVTNAFLGSIAQSEFFGAVVDDIKSEPTVINQEPWQSVGPQRITNVWNKLKYPLTIYPSHYFSPRFFNGVRHRGQGHVFADHFWGTTLSSYDRIHASDLNFTDVRRNADCPCGSGLRYKRCHGAL